MALSGVWRGQCEAVLPGGHHDRGQGASLAAPHAEGFGQVAPDCPFHRVRKLLPPSVLNERHDLPVARKHLPGSERLVRRLKHRLGPGVRGAFGIYRRGREVLLEIGRQECLEVRQVAAGLDGCRKVERAGGAPAIDARHFERAVLRPGPADLDGPVGQEARRAGPVPCRVPVALVRREDAVVAEDADRPVQPGPGRHVRDRREPG